ENPAGPPLSRSERGRLMDRERRKVAAGLAALAAAPAVLAGPATAAGLAAELVVETTAGKVRGARTDGVIGFLGVPYGGSTAGPNRFMPPVRPTPWTGVREAPAVRRISPQHNPKIPPPPPGSLLSFIQESNAEESED